MSLMQPFARLLPSVLRERPSDQKPPHQNLKHIRKRMVDGNRHLVCVRLCVLHMQANCQSHTRSSHSQRTIGHGWCALALPRYSSASRTKVSTTFCKQELEILKATEWKLIMLYVRDLWMDSFVAVWSSAHEMW